MQQKIYYIAGIAIIIILLLISSAVYYVLEKRSDTLSQPQITEKANNPNETYKSPYIYGFSAPYVDLSNLHAFARMVGESNNTLRCGSHTLTFRPALGQSVQANDLPIFINGQQVIVGNIAVFTTNCQQVIYNSTSGEHTGLYNYDILSGISKYIAWHESQPQGTEIGGNIYKPVLDYIFPINTDTLLLSFENATTGKDAYTNFSSQYYFDIPSQTLTGPIPFTSSDRPIVLDKVHMRLIRPVYTIDNSKPIELWDISSVEYIELVGDKKPAKLDLLRPVHFSALGCDTSLSPTDFAACVDGLYAAIQQQTQLSSLEPAGAAYPSDIYKVQLQTGRAFGRTMFEFVLEPSVNYYLSDFSNSAESEKLANLWHGVLIGQYGGERWEKWFSITDPIDPADGRRAKVNPVGIFMEKGSVYLDLVDDRGAGSGEGFLTRLETKDNGKTWKEAGCYYYAPEKYHPNKDFENMEHIAPHALKQSNDCIYHL